MTTCELNRMRKFAENDLVTVYLIREPCECDHYRELAISKDEMARYCVMVKKDLYAGDNK